MLWIRVAAGLGLSGVALGAFGAHALKKRLTVDALDVFKTGVLYHLVHAVALLAVALYGRAASLDATLPCALFTGGVVLFSGSLYALTLSGIKRLGIITPFGGLLFLAGWAAVFTLG